MKKIISVFAAAALLAAAVFSAGAAAPPVGDVNGDGKVNNKDVAILFSRLSSGDEITDASADVNADGSVNNKDVTALFKYVSGDDLPAESYATEFTVSAVFGNGMIIQRREPIRIWGWAPAAQNGKNVRADFAGLRGVARIEDGRFSITLDGTLEANAVGRKLTVSGNGVKYEYSDVLVGDVYWVAGQSNIDYSVSACLSEPLSNSAIRNVRTDNGVKIRLNRSYFGTDTPGLPLGTNDVNEDAVQPRGWQYPSQGAAAFSAVGYYTAYNIWQKLGGSVPIGLIEFDGNGCALHAFLPNEVRDALGVSTCSNGVYSAAGVNAHPSSFMYNHYMYAFRTFPISGIIWYQGESDCGIENNNCFLYADRFAAMIKYFRNTHDQINRDYPVYIVEFPPIYMNFDYAQVRMNMGMIPTKLTNAHICTSADLWKDKTYSNNLHPYNKWEISLRMADIILADNYGVGVPEDSEGPVAVSCTFSADGKTATVKFKNTGSGLKAYGNVLKGVNVITKTEWTSPVSAVITGPDTITVKTATKMLWVGYNTARYDSYPETMTLSNGSGVPSCAWQFSNMG